METLGSLSPASRKSLDRDRRGASRLAVTVPDLLGAGVSGSVRGVRRLGSDADGRAVTDRDEGRRLGLALRATVPRRADRGDGAEPEIEVGANESRSEATDLASAVGDANRAREETPPAEALAGV